MRRVRVHFDFISPYAYLGIVQCPDFAAAHDVVWEWRPVVYGVLLNTHGLVGPVEAAAKRSYTIHDIVRVADRLGVPLQGPPTHPFRSLASLRLAAAHQDADEAEKLILGLARAAWADGRSLEDSAVLADVAEASGLDADAVQRIHEPEIKQLLRANTTEAIDAGVFGVPTFEYEGELFWGADRLTYLGDAFTGPRDNGRIDEMLARPKSVDRRDRTRRE